jgi:predicted DCC family thiol-disulfide oxidoreductase YuxK
MRLPSNTKADAMEEIRTDRKFVRERLHVVDEMGRINVGADAFAALWRNTPRERWMARLVRLPTMRALARGACNWFAARLYAWNRSKKRW